MPKSRFKENVTHHLYEELKKVEKAREKASGYNAAFLDGHWSEGIFYPTHTGDNGKCEKGSKNVCACELPF